MEVKNVEEEESLVATEDDVEIITYPITVHQPEPLLLGVMVEASQPPLKYVHKAVPWAQALPIEDIPKADEWAQEPRRFPEGE